MKRCSRVQVNKTAFALSFACLILSGVAGTSVLAADSDPNQLLAFKKIFVEPVQDNVDGAFKAPVDQSFQEIFDRNPRFELVTNRGDADSSLRTVVSKKTSGIDIDITLSVVGTGEVYSTEHATIDAAATGRDSGNTVKQLLKTTLKRIPFYGTITGRDGKNLTFDIGAAHGLKKGDVIQLSRIDNIKRHPLLKSIVDVQLVPVGSATLDDVEESISFGHVQNEISGESIRRFYKVTAIEARALEPSKKETRSESSRYQTNANDAPGGDDENRPALGYVSLGGMIGQFSSTSSLLASGSSNGSAFNPGFRLSSELWVTKHWFADLQLGYSTMSYNQPIPGTSSELNTLDSVTASTQTIGFDAGYKYLPSGSVYGPQVFAKIGYYGFKWDPGSDASRLLSSKSYSGLNFGIGGSLPVIDINSGVMLGLNVLLFTGLTEGAYKTGSNASTTAVNFFIGGYHHLSSRVAIRAGFQFESYSADFDDGASSTSQKVFGFLPSILYYF